MKLKFRHPSTFLVCGASSSGKSTWVFNLLQANFFDPLVEKIIYCYGMWTSLYTEMQNKLPIEFHKGLIDFEELDDYTPKCVVIDDLMNSATNSEQVSLLKCWKIGARPKSQLLYIDPEKYGIQECHITRPLCNTLIKLT